MKIYDRIKIFNEDDKLEQYVIIPVTITVTITGIGGQIVVINTKTFWRKADATTVQNFQDITEDELLEATGGQIWY